MSIAKVILKKGREKSTLARHPWIFSNAIESVENYLFAGQICDVYSHDKRFLARGYINKNSWIICRLLVWDEPRQIDLDFFRDRILQAKRLRDELVSSSTTAYRLVNSEGDFLPGLIIDCYNDGFVCQFLTAGSDLWRDGIVKVLIDTFKPTFIFERSDVSLRKTEEGLLERKGLLWGKLKELTLEIVENDVKFLVNILEGHKTGFYLDQRDNRKIIRQIAKGRKVLDCFAYTGGFGLNAAIYGATSVTLVESSAKNVEMINKNFELNGCKSFVFRTIKADVKIFLKESTDRFDLIVLDPPKFAQRFTDLNNAKKGYWDINKLALSKLNSGGLLMTFSCSQLVSWSDFQEIIFTAAAKARREVQIVQRLFAAPDHPINIYHPEGEYLKGFLVWVS